MSRRSTGHLGTQFLILAGALLGALAVGAVLLGLAGVNPLRAYAALFTGPLSGRFGMTETLVRATPLLLVGLGVVISFRTGVLNIGGEGQMLMGAVAGAALALALPGWPGLLLLPLTLGASFIAGGLWGAIAGWLKARLAVNEILSTIMLNQIAAQVYIYLIRGPMIDPQELAYGTGTPQTSLLPEQAWLIRLIPGTRLHLGLVLAVLLAGVVYVLLWRTIYGFRMRAVGAGEQAARYAGIPDRRYVVAAMALAGGFAGLAGMVEAAGVHHRLLEGMSGGYGFTGIVAALFGRLHPLGTIPAAILFGGLVMGADMMQRAVAVPAAIVQAILGLVVLFVVASDILIRRPHVGRRLLAALALRPRGGRADGERPAGGGADKR